MCIRDRNTAEHGNASVTDTLRRILSARCVSCLLYTSHAVMDAVTRKTTTKTHGIIFSARNGMLFITLPSGRNLAYVKPKIGTNKFGGDCITYEGVGGTKKWEQLDSYGPKFVENIVQGLSLIHILSFILQNKVFCTPQ